VDALDYAESMGVRTRHHSLGTTQWTSLDGLIILGRRFDPCRAHVVTKRTIRSIRCWRCCPMDAPGRQRRSRTSLASSAPQAREAVLHIAGEGRSRYIDHADAADSQRAPVRLAPLEVRVRDATQADDVVEVPADREADREMRVGVLSGVANRRSGAPSTRSRTEAAKTLVRVILHVSGGASTE
jgi:hypothetical protein